MRFIRPIPLAIGYGVRDIPMPFIGIVYRLFPSPARNPLELLGTAEIPPD